MSNIVTQTRNALNFIRKLHIEISYLIKEIEGLLLEEDERFLLLKPGGYQIIARTSNGLDSAGVDLWMPKDISVFFCPEGDIDSVKSTTITKPKDGLRIILFQVLLTDNEISEPKVIYSYFNDLNIKKKEYTKIEQMLGEFTYSGSRIFSSPPLINFDNAYWSFKGKFKQRNLLSINSNKEVKSKLIEPALKIYRD